MKDIRVLKPINKSAIPRLPHSKSFDREDEKDKNKRDGDKQVLHTFNSFALLDTVTKDWKTINTTSKFASAFCL